MKLHPPSNHPIFGLVGVTPFSLALDVLHVVDHGVSQHLFAGILHSLVYNQMEGRAADNLRTLWTRMQELYREGNISEKLSKFTLSMFCDPEAPHAHFPKLSNAIKAYRRCACVGLSVPAATGLHTVYSYPAVRN